MRICFLLISLLLTATASFSASPVSFPRDTIQISQNLADVKIRDLQKIAQRKFTLKEKMVIKMLQRMERRNARVPIDKDGKLSFLAAVGLLVVYGVTILLINSSAFIVIEPISLSLMALLAIAALWLGLRSKKKIGWRFRNLFGVIIGGTAILLGMFVAVWNLFD